MKFPFTLFSLLFFVISPVSATNFYVGLNAGLISQAGDFSIIDNTLNPSVGINEEKDYQAPDEIVVTGSLFVGYKLGKDLALEFGQGLISDVTATGEVSSDRRLLASGEAAKEKVSSSYTYVAVVGMWPIGGQFAISTRVGFSVWDMTYTQTVTDPAVEDPGANDVIRVERLSDTTSALLIGVGASYGIGRHVELKLTLEQHFVDYAFSNVELDYEAASLTVGIAYHF